MADQRVDCYPGPTSDVTTSHPNLGTPNPSTELNRRTLRRFRSDTGEVASWLIVMAALVAAAVAAGLIISTVIATLADDVAVAAETGEVRPRGEVPDNGDRDAADGTGVPDDDAAAADPDADPLPERTLHCSATLKASAAAVGLGVGLGGTLEFIIKEMPDGTTIVTFAGDVGANAGPGTSAGAGVTVNDATVGAYAAASAKTWGSLGAGVQYVLEPGETVADLLAGIAVSSNPVTGTIGSGINVIFPDTVPTAPLPDTVFVDGKVWEAAGGKARAGIGWVSAGAGAQAQAAVSQTYAANLDGTYSATTSYSGELSGDVGVTGGIPFYRWGTAGLAGEAQGSISVKTIYNSSFEAIEMVVTTSYGYDGDAIFGSDDDNPTITTQQWTLDLTNPDVQQAVDDLGTFVPSASPLPQIPTELPSQLPTEAWDVLATNATTSGAVEQELSTSEIDAAAYLGAIVAGVSGGANGTCTELQ